MISKCTRMHYFEMKQKFLKIEKLGDLAHSPGLFHRSPYGIHTHTPRFGAAIPALSCSTPHCFQGRINHSGDPYQRNYSFLVREARIFLSVAVHFFPSVH